MNERVKADNEKFCHECGELIRIKAEICPKCGVRQPCLTTGGVADLGGVIGQGQPRSRTTTGILALLLGGLGIHKFYLGKPIWGFVYIALIWTFIPAIVGFIEGLNFLLMDEKTFNNRYAGPAWKAA